jgi:hypothetical protein
MGTTTLLRRHLLAHGAWLAGLALLPALLHAEPINDPTRPPPVMAPAAPAGVARAGSAPVAVPPAAPRLQSVQVPQHGVASALVDNKLLFVGDKLGGRTVVAIDVQGLQLRDAKGRTERMPLIDAAVVKQAAALPPGPAPASVAAMAGGQQP